MLDRESARGGTVEVEVDVEVVVVVVGGGDETAS